MSVIAYDGKSIASDMQASFGHLKRTSSKLRRTFDDENEYIIGVTGTIVNGAMMFDWFAKGHDPATFPDCQKDKEDWARLIIAKVGTNQLWYIDRQPVWIPIQDPFMAWGSGEDFALGALAMGATARQAVEIACRFSADCGMGIEEFQLNENNAL